MKPVIANRLSSLRQERKISQRKAAGELGVSQALLSHYENGAREPGLAFVGRACDYYGVTADYLLGRSLSRDGSVIMAGDLPSAADAKDNVVRGSVLAMMYKKLAVNTASLLFDVMGRTRDNELIKAGARYVSLALYKLFRALYAANPALTQKVFTVEPLVCEDIADAEMKYAEADFKRALVAFEGEMPAMGFEALASQYPQWNQSLLSLLHNAGVTRREK